MADPSELTNLASGLGFTLAELELNRARRLSSAQSWAAYRNAAFNLGVVLVIVGLALVILAYRSSGWQRWLRYLFLVAFVGGTFYVWGAQFWGSIQQRVVSADGPLELRTFRGSRQLIVGIASVEAPDEEGVLVVGKRYRIYYVGRTDTFLSIEPL